MEGKVERTASFCSFYADNCNGIAGVGKLGVVTRRKCSEKDQRTVICMLPLPRSLSLSHNLWSFSDFVFEEINTPLEKKRGERWELERKSIQKVRSVTN